LNYSLTASPFFFHSTYFPEFPYSSFALFILPSFQTLENPSLPNDTSRPPFQNPTSPSSAHHSHYCAPSACACNTQPVAPELLQPTTPATASFVPPNKKDQALHDFHHIFYFSRGYCASHLHKLLHPHRNSKPASYTIVARPARARLCLEPALYLIWSAVHQCISTNIHRVRTRIQTL
jgi:hypothetical protein